MTVVAASGSALATEDSTLSERERERERENIYLRKYNMSAEGRRVRKVWNGLGHSLGN